MKRKLQSAIDAADIPMIRATLVEMIDSGYNHSDVLNDIAGALAANPDIFVKDDGRHYADSPADMTETLINSLRADLPGNFSVEKFSLLAESRLLTHNDPHYFSRRESETVEVIEDADGEIDVTSTLVDNRTTAAHATTLPTSDASDTDIEAADVSDATSLLNRAGSATDSGTKGGNAVIKPRKRRGRFLRTIGFSLMALGAAAAIVALCVPISFLLGVGIGVIMLGIALAYAAIPRPSRK